MCGYFVIHLNLHTNLILFLHFYSLEKRLNSIDTPSISYVLFFCESRFFTVLHFYSLEKRLRSYFHWNTYHFVLE
jgi:hypothetical protein